MITILLILFSLTFPALAIDSWSDKISKEIADEIWQFFKKNVFMNILDSSHKLTIGLLKFDNQTEFSQNDVAILQNLLLGKLSLLSDFNLLSTDSTLATINKLFPNQDFATLTQENLKEIKKTATIDFLIGGNLFYEKHTSNIILQIYIKNLENGLLVAAPEFKIYSEEKKEKKNITEEKEKAKKTEDVESTPNNTNTKIVKKSSHIQNPPQPLPLGEFTVIPGGNFAYPILDFIIFNDSNEDEPKKNSGENYELPSVAGIPIVLFLTTGNIEAYTLSDGTLNKIWGGNFKKSFSERTTTGLLTLLPKKIFKGKQKNGINNGINIIVSLNALDGSIIYNWKNKRLEKVEKIDSIPVTISHNGKMGIFSSYGSGLLTFSGAKTFLAEQTSETQFISKYTLSVPVDFYYACVFSHETIDSPPTLFNEYAILDENGIIRLYTENNKLQSKSAVPYGGKILCKYDATAPSQSKTIVTTTNNNKNDTIVLLKSTNSTLTEKWKAPLVDGAISSIFSFDSNNDNIDEIWGIIRRKNKKDELFYIMPKY